MYGMVVMMALTTSAENPDFGKRNKGCSGCNGGYASCYGGYSYGGCCGGGYIYGGCGGGGHYSGCHGGGSVYSGCGGGYSSGCGGGVWQGGRVGYGGTMGERYYSSGYEGSPWMEGSSSGYFPADSTTGGAAPGAAGAAAATVRIRMPADGGRLTIDDYTVPSGGDSHVYVTLPINPNDTRKISFRTEIMRDGKREAVTEQVTVKPGQTADVDFTASGTGTTKPGTGGK